jgi:hypothetical protein
MHAIKGTFKGEQVVLGQTADWPEGIEVLVEPIPHERSLGVREEDWPADPEGIARHLALMDQIEPLVMTPEEEATWQAARKAQKEFEQANWDRRARRIEGLFE